MWFKKWFNEDYENLYAHRSMEEAEKQVEFILKVADVRGKESVLDLACGTGRHCIAFGMAGHKTLGIDLSETLIYKANKRLVEKPFLPVEFLQADLFDLPSIGRFSIAVNLFTSFGYFDDDAQNQKVFRIAQEHLLDNGQFFLDYLHPFEVKVNLVPEERLEVANEIVHIKRELIGDSVVKQIEFPGRVYQEKVKLYTRNQIEKMLWDSGFCVAGVWNDFEGNPWREKGERQLFLCKNRYCDRLNEN